MKRLVSDTEIKDFLSKVTYDDIRNLIDDVKDIDLEDFIKDHGGEEIKEKSSWDYVTLKFNDDKLVVKTSKNIFFVADGSRNSRGGSIIDFVMNYYNLDFRSAIAYCSLYENLDCATAEKKPRQITQEKEEDENIPYEDYKVIPLNDYDINAINRIRKIDIKTIKEFIDVIFKDERNNFCFPCFSSKGVIKGYQVKNIYSKFNGQRGGKYPWYKFISKDKPVIYVFEGIFDAMAYRELKRKNGLYIATGGSFSLKQFEVILLKAKEIKEKLNVETVEIDLCFDNDDAGDGMVERFTKELDEYDAEYKSFITVTRSKPKLKDWNDVLKEKKNKIEITR